MAGRPRPRVAGLRRLSPQAWAVIGLVGEVVILIAVTVWAFPTMWHVSNAIFDEDQSAGPELGVTLSEVSDNPEPFWDEPVTVSARVDQFVDPHTMIIGNGALITGDRVLVVSGPPLAVLLGLKDRPLILDDEVVRVTGIVRRFQPDEIEADLGIEVPAEVVDGENWPSMMVATSVTLDVPPPTGAGDPEYGGSAGPEEGTTLADIHLAPDRYIGRSVTVSGEVEGIFGDHAAWVRDVGVLVIRQTTEQTWFDESSAFLTGTVRHFDLPAIEAELGIDLNDELLAGFAGDAVIIVDEIEIVA